MREEDEKLSAVALFSRKTGGVARHRLFFVALIFLTSEQGHVERDTEIHRDRLTAISRDQRRRCVAPVPSNDFFVIATDFFSAEWPVALGLGHQCERQA